MLSALNIWYVLILARVIYFSSGGACVLTDEDSDNANCGSSDTLLSDSVERRPLIGGRNADRNVLVQFFKVMKSDCHMHFSGLGTSAKIVQ